MNRLSDIYAKVISKENLYRAAYMASRGRRYKDAAADFNFCLEQEINCLWEELSAKTYCHGKYRTFVIYEPKATEGPNTRFFGPCWGLRMTRVWCRFAPSE